MNDSQVILSTMQNGFFLFSRVIYILKWVGELLTCNNKFIQWSKGGSRTCHLLWFLPLSYNKYIELYDQVGNISDSQASIKTINTKLPLMKNTTWHNHFDGLSNEQGGIYASTLHLNEYYTLTMFEFANLKVITCAGFMREKVVKFTPAFVARLQWVRCGCPARPAAGDIGSHSHPAPGAMAMQKSRGTHFAVPTAAGLSPKNVAKST